MRYNINAQIKIPILSTSANHLIAGRYVFSYFDTALIKRYCYCRKNGCVT